MHTLGVGNSLAGFSGLSFKFNSGYTQKGLMFLYHNTVDIVTSGSIAFHVLPGGQWDKVISRNNIFKGIQCFKPVV